MEKLFQKKIIIPLLLLLILGVYFGQKALTNKKNETRYVTAAVEKGTLVVSVSGSGQISASDQIDIKPKVSADIVSVLAEKGEEVRTGKLIMKLDETDFQKAVNDAQTSLETAKLELEELLEPPDELTLLQAENTLTQAQESKEKAEDNLNKAYEDGFNTVSNVFLELPDVMAGLYDIIYTSTLDKTLWNVDYYANRAALYDEKALQYRDDTKSAYQKARQEYNQNFQDYKSASRFSDTKTIEGLIDETYNTVRDIAEAIKNTNNLIQFYKDKFTERGLKPNSLAETHLTSLETYTGKTNSHLSSLLSAQRSIQDYKDAIIDAERSIEEKTLSLAKLKAGADELEIRAKKIVVQQKEDALLTAKQNLDNCSIYAPFNGILADIKVKKGDSVSSGTILASVITKQKIAEISLNEVDAAKVKVDQKATLTFDALPDLTISGRVSEVETVGEVSQGVVSYGVKIALDTEKAEIKPGMSVTADIITDAKQDVLLVPNSAVQSQQNENFVQVMENNTPRSQQVEIGLVNDTNTEIVSGLKEGDIVVTSTISSTQTTQTQTTQQFQIPGMGGTRIMTPR